jgi:hypothetical protein
MRLVDHSFLAVGVHDVPAFLGFGVGLSETQIGTVSVYV